MSILFIFTGGTIGSTAGESCISLDGNKPRALIEAYEKKYGSIGEYDVLAPYSMLSENNTGETVKQLAETVTENIGRGYDGIIVAHGTDTLQYTAAALGYVVGNDSIPVCVVSSNFPLDDERANALDNLYGAMRIISDRLGRGVFVPYKNTNGTLRVHRGTRLLSSRAFSDDVDSVCGKFFGEFDCNGKFLPNAQYSENKDEIAAFPCENLKSDCPEILRLSSYVGMTYPTLDEQVKCVIFESYHSGTVNTLSDKAEKFFLDAENKNIPVFITGAPDAKSYESTLKYGEWGCIPVSDIAPIALYMKLWLAISNNINPVEIAGKSLGGDIII